MQDGFILSIDQGTTGSTVLVFDHAGQVRARAYSEFTQHYPRPGWVEHDPEEIIVVTMKVIADALRKGDIDPDRVRAIGITNQRETVVVWDRSARRWSSGTGHLASPWVGPSSGRTAERPATAMS